MTAPLSRKAIPLPCGLGSRTSEFWREHDDKLRQCAAEGMTTDEAALALGVTKNAVIGRSHRIAGVVWKRSPTPRSKPMRREWEFPEPGRCVYPQGHPDKPGFHFCGDEVVEVGQPYCAEHFLKTHVPIARTEPQPWTVRREPDIGRQWEAAAE